MSRAFSLAIVTLLVAGTAFGQDEAPGSTPEKKSWIGKLFRRGSSEQAPNYRDGRLSGLLLKVEVPTQPVKLSEVRQLEVRVTLTNVGRRGAELQFRSDQRIEIYLRNTEDKILTKWSDNRAFADRPGTILINPQEHIEYNETIATRELTPNRVFVVEVFFPEFPELAVSQKFMTAP